jgi:hypothetical protein
MLGGVHYERDFQREGQDFSAHDVPGIIYFEGQSLAETQFRIIRGGAWDALIADEGTPNDTRQFVLLRRGVFHEDAKCHQSSDGEVF